MAGAVRVPDAEGDLDRLGVNEGRAAGQRDVANPQGLLGGGRLRPRFRPQEKGRRVLLDCAGHGSRTCKEARLLAELPVLPVRSAK